MLRICRSRDIKSTIKYANNGCTRNAKNPQHIAENLLNREFYADAPNEKWLTDVTEFKYYVRGEKHKVYLSAILDLYDRRIVSYVIGDSNNNPLVFDKKKFIQLQAEKILIDTNKIFFFQLLHRTAQRRLRYMQMGRSR